MRTSHTVRYFDIGKMMEDIEYMEGLVEEWWFVHSVTPVTYKPSLNEERHEFVVVYYNGDEH